MDRASNHIESADYHTQGLSHSFKEKKNWREAVSGRVPGTVGGVMRHTLTPLNRPFCSKELRMRGVGEDEDLGDIASRVLRCKLRRRLLDEADGNFRLAHAPVRLRRSSVPVYAPLACLGLQLLKPQCVHHGCMHAFARELVAFWHIV